MMSFKDFSIFSSGGHLVQWSGHFSNFGSGLRDEHFCEIIFKSSYWLESRRYLNVFFYF